MPETIKPRRATFSLEYNNKDISADIAPDVESISYTDSASDTSDSFSVEINATDEKWLNGWLPDEGVTLHAVLKTENWNGPEDSQSLDCGEMVLDDLSFSAEPAKLSIGAAAKPNDTHFSDQEQKFTWKNTSLQRIAGTICGRYGLGVEFDGEDVEIKKLEQEAADSAFLQELCSKYGLMMKVYSKKLWIYDREKRKQKGAAATIDRTDMIRGSFSWKKSLSGTYTGGEFTYSKQSENIKISVKIGQGPRIKKMNQYATNEADARRQLQAAIDKANHGAVEISFTTPGRLDLAAAQCINVTGRGKLDGKYYIDSIKTSLDRSGGLTSAFSCSLVSPL